MRYSQSGTIRQCSPSGPGSATATSRLARRWAARTAASESSAMRASRMPASPEMTSVHRAGSSGAARMRPAICEVTCAAASAAAASPAARDQARSATVTPAQPENSPSSGIVATPGPWRARSSSRPQAPAETCAVPSPAAAASAQPSSTPAVPEYKSSHGTPSSSQPTPSTPTATEPIQASARRAASINSSRCSTLSRPLTPALSPPSSGLGECRRWAGPGAPAFPPSAVLFRTGRAPAAPAAGRRRRQAPSR